MKQKREMIFDVLHQFGPLTSNELNRQFCTMGRSVQPNVPAHLKEMLALGWVKEAGTLRCSVTGMNVTSFEVVLRTPKAG